MTFTICCIVLSSALTARSLEAQQVPADGGSQRILPLPQGRMSDFQTQMELLRRLRSLVSADADSAQPEAASADSGPDIDSRQLEQLQQALKQIQNQLPPGVTPPDLGSIPKEQLDQAMSNPAVQQQLKKMLEQFSRDGLLPESTDGTGESSLPILPPQPNRAEKTPITPNEPQEAQQPQSARQSQTQRPGTRGKPSAEPRRPPRANSSESNSSSGRKSQSPDLNSAQDSTQTPGAEDSPEAQELPGAQKPNLPERSLQSLEDVMKKLSEIAQGDKQQSSPDPQSQKEPTDAASIDERPSFGPDRPDDSSRDRKGQAQGPARPPSKANGKTGDESAERRQQSLEAFQDLLDRYKNAQEGRDSNEANATAEPYDQALPRIEPGSQFPRPFEPPGTETQDALNRVLRRPDRAAPMEPSQQLDRRSSDRGEFIPPSPPTNSETRRDENQRRENSAAQTPSTTPPATKPSPTGNAGKPMDGGDEPSSSSVLEFLKQQLRDGVTLPESEGTDSQSKSSRQDEQTDRLKQDSVTDGRHSVPPQPLQTPPSTENRRSDSSGIDIGKELERRGLKGTLQKLVEKARQESRNQQAENERATTNSDTKTPLDETRLTDDRQGSDSSGLNNSLHDLLGGLDHRMEDIVKDANLSDSPQDARSGKNNKSTGSDSRLQSWNDAASGFLKDLSAAPSAPSAAPSSGGQSRGPLMKSDGPLAVGSFALVGLGLLAIVGVIAFLMRRPLLQIVSGATGIRVANRIVSPASIRSRDDVVTAFHQLAMGPKQLVESWWTHRAAAQTLAAASPDQEVAVKTLAEIYEQARYLPSDVELPAETIQSARSALEKCR